MVYPQKIESSFLFVFVNDVDEQIIFFLSGIFIAGGEAIYDYNLSPSPPGFYNPLTNVYCDLPPMYQPRFGSTTTGFIVCGGDDFIDYYNYDYSTYSYGSNNAPYNCEKFEPSTGTWGPYCASWQYEFPARTLHVAWMSSIGLFLIGGYGKSGDRIFQLTRIGDNYQY